MRSRSVSSGCSSSPARTSARHLRLTAAAGAPRNTHERAGGRGVAGGYLMTDQSPRGQFGIGEVLAQLRPEFPDISTSKIRFLEAEGLIEPARSDSGYRRFSAPDIARLRYILTMQRDSYLPLRVIRERLADGGEGGPDQPQANGAERTAAGLTRHQLLDAADISDAELTELEDYGLIRRAGRQYGRDALAGAPAGAAGTACRPGPCVRSRRPRTARPTWSSRSWRRSCVSAAPARATRPPGRPGRTGKHTSERQSLRPHVCRLL